MYSSTKKDKESGRLKETFESSEMYKGSCFRGMCSPSVLTDHAQIVRGWGSIRCFLRNIQVSLRGKIMGLWGHSPLAKSIEAFKVQPSF